jgi:Cdc6-like AAA superfamily ATPase
VNSDDRAPEPTASAEAPLSFSDIALMAGSVFAPTRPISEQSLFAGRMAEIRRVVDVINQRGRHAIIYGERGVGKTSLANIIATKIRSNRPVIAPRVNCDGTDNFTSLWKKVFAEVDLLKKKRQAPGYQLTVFEETVKAADVVPDNVTPDHVRRLLSLLGEDKLIILVFDEFDRIIDADTRRAMADTIKALSDHDVEATIIVVGVGDSVDELIAEHRSIERAVDQIQMPRMHRSEIYELLRNGVQRLGMTITQQAQLRIALLSQGLPPYAHLLAIHAVRTALDSHTLAVEVKHVSSAIKHATAASSRSLLSDLQKATTSPQKGKHLYREVLLACAMAKTDQFGCFYAADVRGPLSRIMKKPYDIPSFAKHLSDFCQPAKGPVLLKLGVKHKFRYRFIDPHLQPLVIMKGIVDKLITEEVLDERESIAEDNGPMTPAL